MGFELLYSISHHIAIFCWRDDQQRPRGYAAPDYFSVIEMLEKVRDEKVG